MNMIKKIERNIPGFVKDSSRLSETNIQRQFAPVLRELAINNLRHGNGVVAKNFRNEYSITNPGVRNATAQFLNAQSKNGSWGTYLELMSLAEVMNFSVVVKTKTGTFTLYRAENDNAPVMEIENQNNTHWCINGRTLGDGNCLYNSVAQWLQTECNKLQPQKTSQSNSTFFDGENQQVIKSQEMRLRNLVKDAPKPSELEQNLEFHKQRVSNLSEPEQQQIANDYKAAIKLARTETLGQDLSPDNTKMFSGFNTENEQMTQSIKV